ncbi:MAG: exonuclease III [Candidatus Methanofastidiosum methylothiophilum]|uniref:Exonuclease III n=1 Tax=Candidatus Methanofastidiosum methylothiophilum TaxID=1705564 RepID=A0A150J0G2_9EURY|nr:MAG: exonuclease III [Candidatus Methanofastidiosum methylthiophilus]KYC48011.1 MAG: exonuclease III [Candidatus Methanofastidiosum methylthiophilus]KYC50701.1 MAG: exonuclease III [Candidatus Methanofastidiosum methylthiophilus]
MKNIRLLSWNVNGLRSVAKKGFIDFLEKDSPDILCIQETKAREEDLPKELKEISNYYSYFSSPERKGYSGVGVYSKEIPMSVKTRFGISKFDVEGRALILEYPSFILFNIYFPNGKMSPERLNYKMEFYSMFLDYVKDLLAKDKKIIICGDVNTAHKEIDIARPKENEKISGFLPEERAWIDKFIESGFIDTFRYFNKEPNNYSWWDYKSKARERNVGWRIDYFYISNNLVDNLRSAFILNEVFGSDHCPVGIELSNVK